VAAVALGASLFGLAPARPALAEAPIAPLAQAAGPASFADIVERVKALSSPSRSRPWRPRQ